MPFIIIAFAIVIFVLALFVFSYVLIAALVIGLIIFIVGFIRTKFFGYKKNTTFNKSFFVIKTSFSNPTETKKPTEKSGRVIEHDQHDDEAR
ncbi:MAG TPA: hypothetical protein VJK30_04490 [Coxiellaceae bacterium]|nr:MAG: hypothetical protein A3E81_07495 [Gammaproteobacteria bacterium RIFCSPHIGHO2_12_FULL_36_30]HLB56568.1 hypothetical protein [Coxiellaceae bacterium]